MSYKFPLEEHTKFFNELDMSKYITNSWILLPKKLLILIDDFINYKKQFGLSTEIEFYNNITVNDFIKRMYTCRPLQFTGPTDYYLIKDGTDNFGWGGLDIKDYMTYEELELSAFFNLSINTPFFNRGSRHNAGLIEEFSPFISYDSSKMEAEGILIGQVGPRFQIPGKMEYKYMIVTKKQNTRERGYGKFFKFEMMKQNYQRLCIWAKFYDIDYFPTYDEAVLDKSDRYININPHDNTEPYFLDTLIYKKRIEISAEVFLKEANKRAKIAQKTAFCHITGLGLGVWKIHESQNRLTIDVYLDLLNKLKLEYISDVYFAWFDSIENIKTDKIKNISISFGRRNPADPLNNPQKLLISNWAWDSNSYVGNEYWSGNLTTSSDPAAASCSLIAYLGNPDINKITKVKIY